MNIEGFLADMPQRTVKIKKTTSATKTEAGLQRAVNKIKNSK